MDSRVKEGTLCAVKEDKKTKILDIPLDQLLPDPHQPRRNFDPERLTELKESIKNEGLQQLPLVTFGYHKDGKRYYYIKAGERRWRAHRMLEESTMKCIVEEGTYTGKPDIDRELAQAAENSSREPHTHSEIIRVVERVLMSEVQQMMEAKGTEHGAVQIALDKVAGAFGKSRAWVVNYHSLMRLHPKLRNLLDSDNDEIRLNFVVACALAKAPFDKQHELFTQAQVQRKKGGYVAMQRYIGTQARMLREEQGEKVRGVRTADNKRTLVRMIATLNKLSNNFCADRHSTEHKEYVKNLLGNFSNIEVDGMIGDLKVAIITFKELLESLQVRRDTLYKKFS